LDTARWKVRDEFPLLDLVAAFEFKSETSLSFCLGTKENSLLLSDMLEPLYLGDVAVFKSVGWLDIHHPCQGHIKARFRFFLPASYQVFPTMRAAIQQVFEAVGIPADETYEAHFAASTPVFSIEQATDRDGKSDRIY